MRARIVLLPGDGIGPEVVRQAQGALAAVAERNDHQFRFESHPIGGIAIDESGTPLPASTLSACLQADAVLLGAVGGPQWDDPQAEVRPEQGLLTLRREMAVFANLRPIRPDPGLAAAAPLKAELLEGVDLLIVRELTGGLYFGKPRGRERQVGEERAVDTLVYTEGEIRRVAQIAFQLAADRRRLVTSVDKANVLESSRLWRQVVDGVAADHPEIECQHMLVDATAMRLINQPAGFDVILTENLFGDILSDEASVLAGSLGMLPSASLGDDGPGLYEPVHGSAPDIAGSGQANPIAALRSAAMLLRHSLDLTKEAGQLEAAVEAVLAAGFRTPDLGGNHSTEEVGEAVLSKLSQQVTTRTTSG